MINEIIKNFDLFDGSRSKYILFSDWCALMAIAVSNRVWYSEKREQEYLQIATGYCQNEMRRFSEMYGMLTLAFEKEIRDYLGEIYMKGKMGSKHTGQFFTPFHLAELTAQLADLEPDEGGRITLNEPASGGGGMILATAKALQKKGLNYQNILQVHAQDLDWVGVYMTYVQLSIAGINARVVQGDSLRNEKSDPDRILYTPMYVIKGGIKWNT